MNTLKKSTYWLGLALLALSMIGAGAGKLAGVAELHISFQSMNLPTWFGYFIGLLEFLAGVTLFITKFRAIAALSLMPVMIGAAYYHIAYNIPSAIPALLFLVLSLYYFTDAYKNTKALKTLEKRAEP